MDKKEFGMYIKGIRESHNLINYRLGEEHEPEMACI